MKKAIALVALAGFAASSIWVSSAQALPPFKNAFQQKYVNANPALKQAFNTASCNTCHVAGKPKTERNEYGQALAQITGGTVNADINAAGNKAQKQAVMNAALKKLQDAFGQVESQKSSTGATFGEKLKAGRLPAG